jgi:hypothetical protein
MAKAGVAAASTDTSGIECYLGQPTAGELATKYPEADEGGDRDEDAEARDFKTADAKQRRIHLLFRQTCHCADSVPSS